MSKESRTTEFTRRDFLIMITSALTLGLTINEINRHFRETNLNNEIDEAIARKLRGDKQVELPNPFVGNIYRISIPGFNDVYVTKVIIKGKAACLILNSKRFFDELDSRKLIKEPKDGLVTNSYQVDRRIFRIFGIKIAEEAGKIPPIIQMEGFQLDEKSEERRFDDPLIPKLIPKFAEDYFKKALEGILK